MLSFTRKCIFIVSEMKKSSRSFKIPTITVTDPDQIFIISYTKSINEHKVTKTNTIQVPVKSKYSWFDLLRLQEFILRSGCYVHY